MSDVLEEDSAEIAFAALGLKVDGLGVQLARLEKASRRASVDYAPTLANIASDVDMMRSAMTGMLNMPALKLDRAQFAQEQRAARAEARSEMQRELQDVRTELSNAAHSVRQVVPQARARAVQDMRLCQVAAAASLVSVFAWVLLVGPVARALPQSWAVPEKMAAATLGADRWMAGQRMMASAKPADWRGVTQGAALVQNNQAALTACAIQARRGAKPVRCSVKVLPGVEPN